MQKSFLVPPISLITSDQHAGVLFAWLAGWADFPHVSSDAMAPDQSPKATLWGPIGGEGERGGSGAVRVFACRMAGNASKDDSYPILP